MVYFGLEMNRNIVDFGLEMHESLFVFALDLQNSSIFAYVMACVVCLRNELSTHLTLSQEESEAVVARYGACELFCDNFTD